MSTQNSSRPSPQQQPTSYFTKRKPARAPVSSSTDTSSTNNGDIKSTSTLTPPVRTQSMATMTGPPIAGTTVVTGGLAMISSKTFEESQNDLFAKLEALAETKNPTPKKSTMDSPNGGRTVNINNQKFNTPNNSSGQYPFQQTRYPTITHNGNNNNNNSYGGASNSSNFNTYQGSPSSANTSSYTAPKAPERPKEPRRRINSAQFKTPSAADMTELAQIVVANATPPKVQNKLRKRVSTLSLTASTFLPPGSRNPSIIAMTPTGEMMVHNHHNHPSDFDYRHRYEAAQKDSKNWEKKYSSAQNQIYYEREKWEERYNALERAYKELEQSKAEANVEKMNSLLDTVQQLQVSNEVFRKQLQDAGIEPDPSPAVRFNPHQLLVGETLERTFLEENEVLKEKSLITNQKIASLSTEITNAAIAISQTINYVQLRYLTQMLDAAEHVSTQKRSRAMSNTFLSDMLSRGVKKTGSSSPNVKSACTIGTQTQTSVHSSFQQQQQLLLQQEALHQNFGGSCNSFRPLETKLSKSFSFSTSLLNLTGLNLGGHSNQDEVEIRYRLKGGAMDDRSQLLSRHVIPPVIVQDLKGGDPGSPEPITATRKEAPQPKFQYASPTTSQLRIFVPNVSSYHPFGQMSASSAASGSRAGSIYSSGGSAMSSAGVEGPLRPRRSSSDISLMMSGQQQQQVGGLSPNMERTGGKYPYPYVHASRPSSQKSITTTSSSLHRTMSQQFLTPDMALLYSKQ